MDTIKVGIYLKDVEFSNVLTRSLIKFSRGMSFEILKEYADSMDMIITDEDIDMEPAYNRLILTESESIDPPSRHFIYRYEDVLEIISRLRELHYENTGIITELKSDDICKVVVFTGVAGGVGTTSIAIAAAKMLDLIYGSKCLYMNLCTLDDSKKFFPVSEDDGIIRLLYHLEGDDRFPLEPFIRKGDDIDSIKTKPWNKGIREMTPQHVYRLLEAICKHGRYKYFFVDIGTNWIREYTELISEASCHVMVRGFETGQKTKYFSEIERELRSEMVDRNMIEVVNFAADTEEPQDISWEDHGTSPLESMRFYVTDDQTAFIKMGGMMRIDITKNYGLEISAIAKKIVEVCNGETLSGDLRSPDDRAEEQIN